MSRDPVPPEEKAGYRRPPKAHQFQKGRSGNPSGRPKGIKSPARVLKEALERRVTVRIGGRARQVSALEAMMRALTEGAVKGDPRSLKLLLDEIRATEQRAAAEPQTQEVLSAADHAVIAALLARIGGK